MNKKEKNKLLVILTIWWLFVLTVMTVYSTFSPHFEKVEDVVSLKFDLDKGMLIANVDPVDGLWYISRKSNYYLVRGHDIIEGKINADCVNANVNRVSQNRLTVEKKDIDRSAMCIITFREYVTVLKWGNN